MLITSSATYLLNFEDSIESRGRTTCFVGSKGRNSHDTSVFDLIVPSDMRVPLMELPAEPPHIARKRGLRRPRIPAGVLPHQEAERDRPAGAPGGRGHHCRHQEQPCRPHTALPRSRRPGARRQRPAPQRLSQVPPPPRHFACPHLLPEPSSNAACVCLITCACIVFLLSSGVARSTIVAGYYRVNNKLFGPARTNALFK